MSEYKMHRFILEGDKFPILGFTDGHTWNGWECPKFTREQIENYLTANGWNHTWTGVKSDILTIDFENDSPEVYAPSGPSELYTIDGLTWIKA